jgi:hypothetical protein
VVDEDEPDTISMRLALEREVIPDLAFRASAQYKHILENDEMIDDAVNATMGINWQIRRNWNISFSADYNRRMDEDADDNSDPEGHTLLLTVSYSLFGPGRPNQLIGRRTGSLGTGEIRGRVFLDENRNGRYDLNETVLKNIVVMLDGRFQTETDINGQYTFWPVSGGQHFVIIGVEDAPLPWGLIDAKPRSVLVPVRGTAEGDFALVKLNE